MGRYTPEEKVLIYWVPTVASVAAPTVAEFTAGKKLSCELETAPDFSMTGNTTDVPDLCSRVVKKISSDITIADTTAVFYADDASGSDSQIIEGLLAPGSRGYIAILEPVSGSAQPIQIGSKAEMWPVEITSNGKTQIVRGEARKFQVGIAATDAPTDATLA